MSNVDVNQNKKEYHMINDQDSSRIRSTANDHREFFHDYFASIDNNHCCAGSVSPPTTVNTDDAFSRKIVDDDKTMMMMEKDNHNNDFNNDTIDISNKDVFFSNKNHNLVSLFDKFYSNCSANHENVTMKHRNIGKNGLRVPILAFSCWNSFSRCSEPTAESIITAALENGINYFDTGDAFENGQAEMMLGNVLKKKNLPRSSYIISTKIFWKNGPTSHSGGGLSRKFMVEAVEASLRRLQTKYIDILIVHKLDAMCPMEEIVRTMFYLINKGLIFYWGTSRFSPMHIAEAFSIARQFNCCPPICEQMEYHMFTRDKMELQMLELFHKAGIGCITWSPISLQNDEGINFITRRQHKDFNHKYNELMKLCDKLQCDLTQLSLAWCLQNENVNCILITATSLSELYQKLNSIKIYPILTEMVNNEIETILENNPVVKKQHPKTPSITIDVVAEPEYV